MIEVFWGRGCFLYSPRPRARIDFYCGSGEPGYYNCPIHGHLTLTGYPTPDLQYVYTDSVVFNGSGAYKPSQVLFNIYASVVPHNYQPTNNSEIIQKQDIDVYPDPFVSNINIKNPECEQLKIYLINTLGQIVYNMKNDESLFSINLKNLKEGIDVIKISTANNTFIKKLIKLN